MADDRWIPTNGRAPRFAEQGYFVRYRCEIESKRTYVSKDLQWSHHRDGMEDGFDVVAVRKG